jgi:hypothetical protein
MTDIEKSQKLLELGRAVHEHLQKAGDWPRVLVFELYDHKRRMQISDLHDRILESKPVKDGLRSSEVIFSGTYPI